MRVSVIKSDPGYHILANRCCVLLNNKFVFHAFTADEEKGIVFCHKYKNGYVVIDRKRKVIEEEVKTGFVRILVPADLPTTRNRRT